MIRNLSVRKNIVDARSYYVFSCTLSDSYGLEIEFSLSWFRRFGIMVDIDFEIQERFHTPSLQFLIELPVLYFDFHVYNSNRR